MRPAQVETLNTQARSGPAPDLNLTLKRLTQVRDADLIELTNRPRVRPQMSLIPPEFRETDWEAFVAGKERTWTEHGYGH